MKWGGVRPVLAVAAWVQFYTFNNKRGWRLDKHNCNMVSHCATNCELIMTQQRKVLPEEGKTKRVWWKASAVSQELCRNSRYYAKQTVLSVVFKIFFCFIPFLLGCIAQEVVTAVCWFIYHMKHSWELSGTFPTSCFSEHQKNNFEFTSNVNIIYNIQMGRTVTHTLWEQVGMLRNPQVAGKCGIKKIVPNCVLHLITLPWLTNCMTVWLAEEGEMLCCSHQDNDAELYDVRQLPAVITQCLVKSDVVWLIQPGNTALIISCSW